MDAIGFILIGIIIGGVGVIILMLLLPRFSQPIEPTDGTGSAFQGSVSTPLQIQGANERELERRKLSARELQVALLAAQGYTNAQTAHKLGLAPRTVDGYLQRIYPKLKVNSRIALARKLHELGYDDDDLQI